MENVLLKTIDYKIEQTRFGTWRRHLTPQGSYFAEFKSHTSVLGLPLLHYTRGKCPETGRRIVAKGIVGVGRIATGVVALGHVAFGLIAMGQAGLGLLLGLGQLGTGCWALGQGALGVRWGIGQLATGYSAIGQLALGKYVLAQLGVATYAWTPQRADPEAVAYFTSLWEAVRACLGL